MQKADEVVRPPLYQSETEGVARRKRRGRAERSPKAAPRTVMGQLPLQELMDGLPGFGLDSRLDSRKLVPAGLPVSASVPPEHDAKTGNPLVNKGDCPNLSLSVPASPQSEDWRREGDSNPTISRR
jgi:hypothetical protein